MKMKVIVDTSAGEKHLSALKLIANNNDCEILGVTLSWVDYATVEQICAVASANVPVYAGCPGAMVRYLYQKNAKIPAPVQLPMQLQKEHAVAFLIGACRNAEEPVTIVALDALTNIGTALRIAPDIAGKIREVLIIDRVQKGAFASENIQKDPEAAQILVQRGVPIAVVQLDPDAESASGLCAMDNQLGQQINVQICVDRGLGAGALLCSRDRTPNARIITQKDITG